jgi:hypothetical protein
MTALKPMERSDNPRQMNDAQRLHYYGRLKPMHQPNWLERLIDWARR